jgi:hypothetical protein
MSGILEKDSWIKRTTIDEPRLSEIVKEYKLLGFEVHLESVKLEDLNEDCRRCYQNKTTNMKTVYIRRRK